MCSDAHHLETHPLVNHFIKQMCTDQYLMGSWISLGLTNLCLKYGHMKNIRKLLI